MSFTKERFDNCTDYLEGLLRDKVRTLNLRPLCNQIQSYPGGNSRGRKKFLVNVLLFANILEFFPWMLWDFKDSTKSFRLRRGIIAVICLIDLVILSTAHKSWHRGLTSVEAFLPNISKAETKLHRFRWLIIIRWPFRLVSQAFYAIFPVLHASELHLSSTATEHYKQHHREACCVVAFIWRVTLQNSVIHTYFKN